MTLDFYFSKFVFFIKIVFGRKLENISAEHIRSELPSSPAAAKICLLILEFQNKNHMENI